MNNEYVPTSGKGRRSSDRDEKAERSERSWRERIAHLFNIEPKSREDLLEVLQTANENDLIDNEALGIIDGALKVSDKQAREILVPTAKMVSVDANETPAEFLKKVTDSAHSRFPVMGENADEVLGILLAKDLLPYLLNKNLQSLQLEKLLRPVTFVPESKRLNVLLREFRQTRNHMAIVLDEYGGVAGLVTIEDVLEEIVGEIEDEHDKRGDSYIRKLSECDFLIKALTPIENFNRHFEADFNESEFDTIGGILMQQFGHLPKRNEVTSIDGYKFRVLNADNRQIHLLRMTLASNGA